MATDIVVPALGESVTEATVAKWMKQVGDKVAVDEALLELETDKVSLEVYATQAGTLSEIRAKAGDTVEVGAVVGVIGDGATATSSQQTVVATGPEPIEPTAKPAPAAPAAAASPAIAPPAPPAEVPPVAPQPDRLAPSVRKLVEEHKLAPEQIPATG
jgi:2-oxoglutarate dehydrogenase E2 component (dihydrolipoamide succinyltransferase)